VVHACHRLRGVEADQRARQVDEPEHDVAAALARGNQYGKLRWCTARRQVVVEFGLGLARALLVVSRLIRLDYTPLGDSLPPDELSERDRQRLFDLHLLTTKHGLGSTRQAISQHLGVPESAGLVKTGREGRYKFHYLDTTPLETILERWRPTRKRGQQMRIYITSVLVDDQRNEVPAAAPPGRPLPRSRSRRAT
jgi:DNA-binding transcriptional ArsR family regulator